MLTDSRKRWVLFSGLTSFFLSIAMLYQMSPFFLTYAEETAGADAGEVGMIFAMLPFAAFIASMPAASLINVYGTRIALAVGLCGLAASSCMFGLSDSVPAWLVWRFAQGISTAPIYSAVAVMFANTFHGPGEFATVSGIQEGMANVGFALGPALGGFLFQVGGFFAPFGVSAVGHLAFVGLSLLSPSEEECEDDDATTAESKDEQSEKTDPLLPVEEGDENDDEVEPAGLMEVMSSEIALIIPSCCIFCGVFGALDPVYAKHFRGTLGVTEPSTIGMLMSLLALPSIVLALAVPRLMERFSGHVVMTGGVCLMAVSCIVLGLSDPDAATYIGWRLPIEDGSNGMWALQICLALSLGSASAFGWIPALPDMMEKASGRLSKQRNIEDREKATAAVSSTISSLFNMGTALGEGLGPICGGQAISRFGFGGTFLIFGLILLVYLAVLCIAPWTRIEVYPKKQPLRAKCMHAAVHLTPVQKRPPPRSTSVEPVARRDIRPVVDHRRQCSV